MAKLTVSILDGAIATETESQKELEAEKSTLEKLNKTSDSYCKRFTAYLESLKAMKDRVDDAVDDVELLRDQLVELKCSVPAGIDSKLDVLRDFGIWADVESSPVMTQFLQCLKVPDVIDVPGEEDEP